MCRFLLSLLFFTFTPALIADLQSQREIPDQSQFTEYKTAGSLIIYTDSVYGRDIRLVNGRIYQPLHLRSAGHPFYINQDWLEGSVIVNGQQFTGINLQYDIYEDKLIYIHRSADGSVNRLQLSKEYVKGFTIRDHRFITMGNEKIPGLDEPQYFEALVIDNVCLLNKWEKKFEQGKVEDFPYGRFLQENKSTFILKEGELMKINNRPSLLKCLEDKKPELKQFMKANKLMDFYLRDNELTLIIDFYNNIL